MTCKKCSGRIFVDRMFEQNLRIELFCIMCGKRWFIKKDSSGFAQWLAKKEKALKKDLCIST